MEPSPIEQLGYETKPADYFEQLRSEMLPFVPPQSLRVLDVGCGRGGFGELLKRTRQVEVWGVEPVKSAAIEAATKLDRVIEGMFSPDANLPTGYFDCVLFNDVLEHLLDPKSALQLARTLLRQGGLVVASIPNIRHFQTQWRLLVHGEWVYRDSGTLDRTHLRFFTCKSIAPLFVESGYDVEQFQGINPFWSSCLAESSNWRYFKILNLLTLGGIEDMKYLQFAVVARPRALESK